ncbi:hypothetical protein CBP52_17165 [Cellulomonas sp. PSBB021]|nr:hypothetical protein CBP52_17165 [Cellulomonas sp. PSBB021]
MRIAAAAGVVVLAVLIVLAVTSGRSDDGANPTSAPSTAAASTPGSTAGATTASTPAPGPTVSDAPTTPAASAEPSSAAPGVLPTPTPRPDGRAVTLAPIESTAEPSPGVTARVASIRAVTGKAELPGEVGGPALEVTVEVHNGTDEPLDLSLAVLNVYSGPGLTPELPLSTGSRAFPGEVAPGADATGVFVHTVAVADRGDVTIELDLGVGTTIALFRGPAGV